MAFSATPSSRKVVDIDYYVDMGGVAYGRCWPLPRETKISRACTESTPRALRSLSTCSLTSAKGHDSINEDLLKLYDRYLATGSRLAEGQLVEKGLLNSELTKAKTNKM